MAETPPLTFAPFLRSFFAERERIDILEVGGGSASYVGVPDARYTVLDLDGASVSRNRYADEVLIGDARTVDLEGRGFDAVVFWNVLEHVSEPERAVANMLRALRPGGVLIVRGPLLRSLKALLTRATPHWVHVLFYRRVLGHVSAGQPGRAPFPTTLSNGADADTLIAHLARRGFGVVFEARYVGDQVTLLRQFSRAAHAGYEIASAVLRALTGNRWGSHESDFVIVFASPDLPVSPASTDDQWRTDVEPRGLTVSELASAAHAARRSSA